MLFLLKKQKMNVVGVLLYILAQAVKQQGNCREEIAARWEGPKDHGD
jgi:tRNA U34 2-thiouridine synthase MnmA/TrmU